MASQWSADDQAGPETAPNLDQESFLSRVDPSGDVSVRWGSFGDLQEVTAVFVVDRWNRFVDPVTGEVHRPRVAKGEATAERKQANQKRNGQRAKQEVRRLARLNQLRYLITVTFPGFGEHDFARANRAISTFCRKRAHVVLLGRSLAVPELHPKGHGWHWHLLTPHRLNVAQVRLLWTQHLRSLGYERPATRSGLAMVNATDLGAAKKAAGYAAKYVGKTFGADSGVPEGSHRYHPGRSLEKPIWATDLLIGIHGLRQLQRRLAKLGVPERSMKPYPPKDGAPAFVYAAWDDPPG